MKFLLPILSLSLLLSKSVESRWVPHPGITWNYLLAAKDDVILNRKEEVLTIDVNKSAELIEKLHQQGKKVICYFSGGTIEKHRDDYEQYLAIPGLVRDPEGKTKWDELWLDYRMPEIRPLIKNRMKKAIAKKCDAIEVDCLGAYNHKIVTERWKDPLTKEDAYDFAKWLSAMAHDLGISIGLKNVAGIAPRLVNDFDFAIVESCSRSKNVCAKYQDFPKQGKAVFTIHYGDYGSFETQKKTMVEEQKNFGYTCTFNDDDNLKNPGYSYNCDTGSKTKIAGNIPKVTNNSNNSKKTTSKSTVKTTTKSDIEATTKKSAVIKTTTNKINKNQKTVKTTTKPLTKKSTSKLINKKTTTKPINKNKKSVKTVVKKRVVTKKNKKN